ncbi:MAG: ABC transporter ATP-binding protein [Planctomycetaceae bacterium]|jgi:NitT/TauT family transport system ATP-binding protein|nr:ABC transporter ATP-binding protein [Planctomycetaceae bacterium]
MSQYALEIRNVSHRFGEFPVLDRINLKIWPGQIVAIVGPSGCGKSTLLKAILGTHPPSEGEILADGQPVTGPTRNVGIVFQQYSLYDFLTAEGNVAFGLKLDQSSFFSRLALFPKYLKQRRQHLTQAREFLEKVGLEHACGKYPGEMSGGMKQRVAVAQALIMRPKVVLLDEPFGALDEAMREELQYMLLGFYQENLQRKREGKRPEYTILMVTHELNEAIFVADRVIGMSRFHTEGNQGATIVYDKPCPVFHPDDPRDYSKFLDQREELRRAVFDDEYIKDRNKYVTFWNDLSRLAEGRSMQPNEEND